MAEKAEHKAQGSSPREGERALWLRTLTLSFSSCVALITLLCLNSSSVRWSNIAYFKGGCKEVPAHRKSCRGGAASRSPDAICQLRKGPGHHLSNPVFSHENLNVWRNFPRSCSQPEPSTRAASHHSGPPILGFSSPPPANFENGHWGF